MPVPHQNDAGPEGVPVQGRFATRPVLHGSLGMLAAGHYLSSAVGLHVLEQGGNAVDAGVAAGFALSVVKPQSGTLGGEAPILIHMAHEGRTVVVNGQGWAPRRATIDWFRSEDLQFIPGDGFLGATVPAAFASWCVALQRFGTASLSDVLGPAIEIAEGGFAVYEDLRRALVSEAERMRTEWPTSEKVFLANGRPPDEGEILKNPDWASTMKRLLDTANRESHRGREAVIDAAMDYFYMGPIAQLATEFATTNRFHDASGRAHSSLLTVEDWIEYRKIGTRLEQPVRATYRGIEVCKCGTWSQGPVFLQQLKLLEGYDLAALGHNSVEYLHLYLEAAKLAFADRDRFYGDPEFVEVPIDRLVSAEYAETRRRLIDLEHASLELRPGEADEAPTPTPDQARPPRGRWQVHAGDTTHVDAVDRMGNLLAATPSGGWFMSSPLIEGLGFGLGTRAQMFSLEPGHPNALAPGKRPRTTLTPSLALRDGKPWLAFGTEGGDRQDQWTLQFLLNVVEFGMDLQEAIDAPTVNTSHFPDSFYPHAFYPGRCHVEGRIPVDVRAALERKGHEVHVDEDWSHGQVTVAAYDARTGSVSAAASPRRRVAYAMGR